MPALNEGDLLAIMSAGAYGFVMASNYNSRPLPAEVLVRGDKFALIRKRETQKISFAARSKPLLAGIVNAVCLLAAITNHGYNLRNFAECINSPLARNHETSLTRLLVVDGRAQPTGGATSRG